MLCRVCKVNEGTMVSSTTISNGKKYIYYSCVSCNTKTLQEYRKTYKGKLAVKRAVSKYEKLNPERRSAWIACQRLGTNPCEVCGDKKTDKHHPDVLKKLEVIWLCRLHHKQAHKV